MITIINIFNEGKFQKNFSCAIEQLDCIESLADDLNLKEIKKVIFIGSGGAYTKFVNMRPLIFKSLYVPFIITSPEELVSLYLNEISSQTLVVFGTKTGETLELIKTLNLIKKTKENIPMIGFIGDDNTSIDKMGLDFYRISSVDTDVHLVLLGWLLTLLDTKINSKTKLIIKKELESMGLLISKVLSRQKYALKESILNTNIESKQMWIGSGRLWGEICCYTNYILEEIQWIFSQPIHSSEFFHGPFELIDDEFVPNLVLNTDENRVQDLRVKNFIDKFDKEYVLIDMQDYILPYKMEETKEIIEPYILNHIFDIMLDIYTSVTGKSTDTRRYYRKTDY